MPPYEPSEDEDETPKNRRGKRRAAEREAEEEEREQKRRRKEDRVQEKRGRLEREEAQLRQVLAELGPEKQDDDDRRSTPLNSEGDGEMEEEPNDETDRDQEKPTGKKVTACEHCEKANTPLCVLEGGSKAPLRACNRCRSRKLKCSLLGPSKRVNQCALARQRTGTTEKAPQSTVKAPRRIAESSPKKCSLVGRSKRMNQREVARAQKTGVNGTAPRGKVKAAPHPPRRIPESSPEPELEPEPAHPLLLRTHIDDMRKEIKKLGQRLDIVERDRNQDRKRYRSTHVATSANYYVRSRMGRKVPDRVRKYVLT
ncbi:hypothetical protein C8J57DRAFT_1231417 [Mycena rebaudengoi]|nr:hypothetical protein C8J57DRAFT_1231417 [Mycena rebaudengoi]